MDKKYGIQDRAYRLGIRLARGHWVLRLACVAVVTIGFVSVVRDVISR